jgi:uncharacterized membrane protein YjjP (DUF1212 family)
MQAVKGLLSVVVLLAAIAPTLMGGGRLIVAFMLGKGILPVLFQTVACMAVLVPSGMVAARLSAESSSFDQILISSAVLLVPTWAVYLAFEWWIKKKTAKEKPAS